MFHPVVARIPSLDRHHACDSQRSSRLWLVLDVSVGRRLERYIPAAERHAHSSVPGGHSGIDPYERAPHKRREKAKPCGHQ